MAWHTHLLDQSGLKHCSGQSQSMINCLSQGLTHLLDQSGLKPITGLKYWIIFMRINHGALTISWPANGAWLFFRPITRLKTLLKPIIWHKSFNYTDGSSKGHWKFLGTWPGTKHNSVQQWDRKLCSDQSWRTTFFWSNYGAWNIPMTNNWHQPFLKLISITSHKILLGPITYCVQ